MTSAEVDVRRRHVAAAVTVRAAGSGFSRTGLALSLAAFVLWSGRLASQPAGASVVLDRTTAYVQSFFERFVNVVAEERYIQTAEPGYTRLAQRRVLVSDFLLVQPQGSKLYYQFRDVREVDGQAVTDRERRLTELFLQPWDTAIKQASRIVADSARYNVVNVGTINHPLQAVVLLQPRYRARLDFSVGGRQRLAAQELRVITFRERDGQDTIFDGLRSFGRAWVDEATGMVMKTELELRSPRRKYPDKITTSFVFDERLQLAVPAEMRDSFYSPGMSGVATYGQFRTFQVRTAEEVRP